MKKAIICFTESPSGAYMGGVITIINNYFNHTDRFKLNGFDIEWFNYQLARRVHNSKLNNIFYGIAQRSALLKKLSCEKCDVLNIHTSREFLFLKDIWLAKSVAHRYDIPIIVTVHVGDAQTVFNRISAFRQNCISIINQCVNKVVFLSEEIRHEFITLGISPERTEVLYNFHCLAPLPPERVKPRRAKLHLLFVGAIHREKGIIELLQALCELQELDIHLDVCGQVTDMHMRDEFEHLISALGERATVCGYVQGEEKSALFERADVLILPSYHEGMPLVILEALACGCAIISTRVGTTPEILTEENARWVAIQNSEEIVLAIRQLYENTEYLDQMKVANLEKASQFTLNQNIDALCNIYGA